MGVGSQSDGDYKHANLWMENTKPVELDMSIPLKETDPCYWMLEQGRKDPNKRTPITVHKGGCYICEDPEFSLMGLPVCSPCDKCGGHVAADDSVCDACGYGHIPEEYACLSSDVKAECDEPQTKDDDSDQEPRF